MVKKCRKGTTKLKGKCVDTSRIIFVRRVSYGKKSTPKSKREYRATKDGPVGTIKELIDAGFIPVIESVGGK